MEQVAHQIAKARKLDEERTDGFLVALRERRQDLAGLPFVMGEGCRTTEGRARCFGEAVRDIHLVLSMSSSKSRFWTTLPRLWEGRISESKKKDPEFVELMMLARVAALTQILVV